MAVEISTKRTIASPNCGLGHVRTAFDLRTTDDPYRELCRSHIGFAPLAGYVGFDHRPTNGAFPAYVGQHVFEDMVGQAYRRHWQAKRRPAIESWSRWRGSDRNRKDLDLDVVARVLDGRMMTGSIKLRSRPADAATLDAHVKDLDRLAASGRGWAKEALDPRAPLLFVSSGGFTESFRTAANSHGQPTILWTLDDLF